MSYTKQISFRNYQIEFEYDYLSYPECLVLKSWTAYIGPNEIEIPCRVESDFIESNLINWIDNEWAMNGSNYIKDYVDSLSEKRYAILNE